MDTASWPGERPRLKVCCIASIDVCSGLRTDWALDAGKLGDFIRQLDAGRRRFMK